jgi:hypothetical protein
MGNRLRSLIGLKIPRALRVSFGGPVSRDVERLRTSSLSERPLATGTYEIKGLWHQKPQPLFISDADYARALCL